MNYTLQKILLGTLLGGVPLVLLFCETLKELQDWKANGEFRIYFLWGALISFCGISLGLVDLTGIFERVSGDFWRYSRFVVVLFVGGGLLFLNRYYELRGALLEEKERESYIKLEWLGFIGFVFLLAVPILFVLTVL